MENEKCVYGCGNDAKYTFKNGNKCCSKSWAKCPELRRKNSERLKESYKSGQRKPLTHDGYREKLAWSKGKTNITDARIYHKYKLSEILCDNSLICKSHLRKTILSNNLIPYKCAGENCLITNEWIGKKITLDLDHINGKNTDHRLENLRFLCPNCHSQTPTFRRSINTKNCNRKDITDEMLIKKIKEGLNNNEIIKFFNAGVGNYYRLRKIREKLDKEQNMRCVKCNEQIKTKSKTGLCVDCAHKKSRKIDRPPYESLEKEIIANGYEKTGRKYGVCGNTVKNWLFDYEKQIFGNIKKRVFLKKRKPQGIVLALKNKRIENKKIKQKNQADRKRKVLESKIDFTKIGWLTKLAKEHNITKGKMREWLIRNMPDFYNEHSKCFHKINNVSVAE